MKYFVNEPYTLYTLRKEFDELCKTYHPQNGGNTDTFHELLNEYYDLKEKAARTAKMQRANIRRRPVPDPITPPAEDMRLAPMIHGVFIINGDTPEAYNLRREITLHGGRWEPNKKYWYATTPCDIRALCDWFGEDYEAMKLAIDELTNPTIGHLAAMVENGENVSGIKRVTVGSFDNFQSFLAYFGNHYTAAVERLAAGTILQSDIVTLKNFANEMLCAFGFSTTDNQKAVQ